MNIDARQEGTQLVLAPHGAIDSTTVKELDAALQAKIAGGASRVVLDLTAVPFLDSSGIGIIVRFHRALKEKSGELVVAGSCDAVLKVFKLIRLHQYLKIVPTVAEALTPA